METLKFLYRFTKHLLIFLFILLPLQLIGLVLLTAYLPIHLYLVRSQVIDSIKLPYALRWFDNADQYVGRDVSTYLIVFGSGYWNLLYWLTIRNPLNYFGYTVLGIVLEDNIQSAVPSTPEVGDATGQKAGLFYTEVLVKGKKFYEYYYIYKYSQTKCLRIRIGHKIGLAIPGKFCQYVGVISPYHSYKGE